MTDFEPIRLGPFDVYERAGTGGMGIVYRATHRATGSEVAVKVLRGEPDERPLRLFRREVQSHAGLVHPAIVQLLDYGNVSAELEEQSQGKFKEGSPYVAMEYASGGTLRGMQFESWPEARHAIRPILEGLAHAHARGLIHRDLKPDNLLVFADDSDWSVKLTDFGIAHALQSLEERGTESLGRIIGTPKYMAPEQLLGRWRDHGPWTDLYAVGCLVFEFVSGEPPYTDISLNGIAEALAHFSESRPELKPQFEIPTALEQWIATAMAVEPSHRFARAAEALAALPEADARTTSRIPVQVDQEFDPTVVDPTDPTISLEDTDSDAPTSPSSSGLHVALDIPSDWRGFEIDTSMASSAGLGLVGLRSPPVIGREKERDALWEALQRVATHEHMEVVLLEGEAGIGKSRLAEWATTLAHEVGAAQVIRLGELTRGTDGLEECLRTWRLDRRQIYEHLLRTLPPLLDGPDDRSSDARALAELVRPATQDVRETQVVSLPERLVVVQRLIRRFAGVGPTVVWCDDVHEAPSTQRLVQQMLGAQIEAPLLFVMTVRSDLVARDENLVEVLDSLASSPSVSRLEIGPLDAEESLRLARQMARIPDDVVNALVDRMDGNPLFGVQLLTDWVERGLKPSEDGGLSVDSEVLESVPADIHSLWEERIARLVHRSGRPGALRRLLELAGTLGADVDDEEWRAVDAAGDPLDPALWRILTDRGLVRRTERGWSFQHGLLVQSLRRMAQDAGRWEEHNLRCARALDPLFRRNPFRYARRIAEHWLAAGRPEKALVPLGEEADRAMFVETPEAARELLLQRERIMDELGVPEDDLLRAHNEISLTQTDMRLGAKPEDKFDALVAIAERVAPRGPNDIACDAWRSAAKCQEAMGNLSRARECARKACTIAEQAGDMAALAEGKLVLARSEFTTGREHVAARHAEDARRLAMELGDDHLTLRARQTAAWAAAIAGDVETARKAFYEGIEQSRAQGALLLEADAYNGLGDLARQREDWASAFEAYRRARELYQEVRHIQDAAVVELNIAAAEAGAGMFEQALARLEENAQLLYDLGFHFFKPHVDLARLPIAAGLGDWDTCVRLLPDVRRQVLHDEFRLSRDDVRTLQLAERFALERGADSHAGVIRAFREELEREFEARKRAGIDAT